MTLNTKRAIPYLVVLVPLILVLIIDFLISDFYIKSVKSSFKEAQQSAYSVYIQQQKVQNEMKINQLLKLLKDTNNQVEPALKRELQMRVESAYSVAHKIADRYKNKKRAKARVKEALQDMVFNGESNRIFVTDYNANAILLGSHLKEKNIAQYLDRDGRSIVYEEIQKVRRHAEGCIKSVRESGEEELVCVKDLGLYKWYVGTNMLLKKKQESLEESLLEMIKSMPLDSSEFVGIYRDKEKLYLSDTLDIKPKELKNYGVWHKREQREEYFYLHYFEPFRWSVLYGFDASKMHKNVQKWRSEVELKLQKEFDSLWKISALVTAITLSLSFLLALRVHKIVREV